jgi:hypothetical protein
MKMKRFMGGSNIPDDTQGEQSPGAIAIETLSNMRTIASLTLENKRSADYAEALQLANPNPVIENLSEGAALGFGQLSLMWVFALLIHAPLLLRLFLSLLLDFMVCAHVFDARTCTCTTGSSRWGQGQRSSSAHIFAD